MQNAECRMPSICNLQFAICDTPRRRPRRGFTLVEMLVVITIIGILASLITVGAYSAIEAAKKVRIKTEMSQLHAALEAYKQKYGDYPPSILRSYKNPSAPGMIDLWDAQHPVRKHLAKAFPRMNEPTGSDDVWHRLNMLNMTPAQALVFWLQGFSADPVRPLSGGGDRKPLFDFDKTRLTNPNSGWTGTIANPNYIPSAYRPQDGKDAPYVYYEARMYRDQNGPLYQARYSNTQGGTGTCMPYMQDINGNGTMDTAADQPQWDKNSDGKLDLTEYPNLFANPKSFQIISAGLDGNYGSDATSSTTSSPNSLTFTGTSGPINMSGKVFRGGNGYNADDDDNLTNFSEKALGDAKP